LANAIEARELRKTYPGPTVALDGLSFEVGEGQIFALLGPNGAGKSTTVKVLTTLTVPDSGRARVAGIDVLADPRAVRRVIGVVGQRSGVDDEAEGRENLELQGQLHGIRGRELRRRVEELLEAMGLAGAAERLAGTYSGGMRRRLDIAMGLVHRPRVLFLDEPTTGLDPEIRVAMWDEIRRLRDQGLTILLTTHYLEEADELADSIAIVDRGRIVARGTAAELKAELEGDTVHVEVAAPGAEARAREALARLAEVREVHVDGRAIHARVGDGATALPAVLGALSAAGVPVAAATMARPSLDDVYMRHAGRSFEEAERSRDGSGREAA